MKHIIANPRKISLLSVAMLLLASMLACQLFSSNPGGASTPPTSTSSAGGPGSQETTPVAGTPNNAGTGTFPHPNAGLETLSSYHQRFTSTMSGTSQSKPYEATTNVDRWVNGEDESSLVQSTTSGDNPFYLQITLLGGQTYVQQKAGQACRAQDQSTQADQNRDPALKLPPVFGASVVSNETLAGVPAIHENFDADAVRNQAGKNGTADGEIWVAQDSGTVLRYQLTIEIKDGDFIGTRTWVYELSDINQGLAIKLPAGCLPMLTELPVLPDAAGVVSIPGFMSYTANSSIDSAVKFFQEQLPATNWYPLPGDTPQASSRAAQVRPIYGGWQRAAFDDPAIRPRAERQGDNPDRDHEPAGPGCHPCDCSYNTAGERSHRDPGIWIKRKLAWRSSHLSGSGGDYTDQRGADVPDNGSGRSGGDVLSGPDGLIRLVVDRQYFHIRVYHPDLGKRQF